MRRLLLLLLVTFALAHPQGKTKDQLIDDIFGTGGDSSSASPPPSSSSTETPNRSPDLTPGGLPGAGPGCECVPFYLCQNGTINKDGKDIIDIRINESGCGSYLEVCCGQDDRLPPTSTTTTTSPATPRKPSCGHRHPDGVGFRITGDKDSEAQFGEFPWMVAVLREETVEASANTKLNIYQCGGALIHPSVVLTAAHCVTGKKQLKVRAGEWDTQTTQEILPHQDRDVAAIVAHEQYYAGALFNDVALLFLAEPVDIAENVNIVCLPTQGAVFDHSRCFASGWGKDVFGKDGKYQVILKKIDLPVVPREKCQTQLRTTRLGKHFELHKSFICAGGEPGKDTCKGDGGSPLVCPIEGQTDRYQQAGIVAWGIGCGDNNTPGVYANVAMFRDWINLNMKQKNYFIDED